jgi:hypothetical protein
MSCNFNRSFRDALGLSNIFVKALNWIRELNAFQSVKMSCNMWITFFLTANTADLTWVYVNHTKTKWQSFLSKNSNLLNLKKAQVDSEVKIRLICCSCDTVHHEFVPQGLRHVECHMKKVTRNVVPPWWQCTSSYSVIDSRVVCSAFDSCPCKTSLITWSIPSKLVSIPQNKNDPERKISNGRRHHHYMKDELGVIKNILWTVFQKWKRQWEWCISAQGNYFEAGKCN